MRPGLTASVLGPSIVSLNTNNPPPPPPPPPRAVRVFITAVPIIKLFVWGEGDSGGHVLQETTSRGLDGLVCPARTSERGVQPCRAFLDFGILYFTITWASGRP
jgi:hypothetical protein